MDGLKWVLLALLAAGPAGAQGITYNERLVELAEVLGIDAQSSSAAKIRAIHELGDLRMVSGVAGGLLFDRANVRYEGDPLVREAAAQELRFVLDRHSRMAAMRLGRLAGVAQEPDPRVRIAALHSLAAFESTEAAAIIYDAATQKEPEAMVRAAAQELIAKGLAASPY